MVKNKNSKKIGTKKKPVKAKPFNDKKYPQQYDKNGLPLPITLIGEIHNMVSWKCLLIINGLY